MLTRSIAFLNQKGGVGKTTTTVNLASALSRAGRRVGVIDLDPQAHLTLHFGIEPEPGDPTVYDLLVDDEVTADSALIEVEPNLLVMPSEVDLAAAEVELASAPDRISRLSRKLASSELVKGLEFLLIDCPPSLSLLTVNALAAVREVMVPMQAHFLALQGVGKLLETVGMVCRQVNPDLQVTAIILCMFEGNTRLAGEVTRDLEEFFDSHRDSDVPWRRCKVMRPAVRRNIKLAESPSFGMPIFQYDSACPGAQDYRKLADALIEEWDEFLARRTAGKQEPITTNQAMNASPRSSHQATSSEAPEALPTPTTPQSAPSRPTGVAQAVPAIADVPSGELVAESSGAASREADASPTASVVAVVEPADDLALSGASPPVEPSPSHSTADLEPECARR